MQKSFKKFVASILCASVLIGPLNSVYAAEGPATELEFPPEEPATEPVVTPEEPAVEPIVTPEETQLLDLTANELPGEENIVVVEEFDESGQLETKTTYDEGTIQSVDVENSPTIEDAPNKIIANDGSMSYVLIDTFTGSSKVIATLSNWVYQFGAAYIPAKFFKTNWAASAGSATYNTFLPPPTIKYYKTWVYQAQDSYNYYGKTVSKKYTDSTRTQLEKTTTFISRIPK